ncbi:hypothetical protein ACFSKM_07800 [Ancylobacter dichloromethanicus]
MAGQSGKEQASFASGELGDLLAERKNLKYYRSGLKRAENMVATPQGPASQRPYTRLIGRRRPVLAAISLAGATLGAPSGGTAGNATDGDDETLLTTGEITGGPHVVFTATFAAPVAVAAVDVDRYRLSTGTGTIEVQYQTGAGWSALNGPRKLLAGNRSRRFCAPPTQPVTASAWRVVAALSEAATMSIDEVAFLNESATFATARVRSFGFFPRCRLRPGADAGPWRCLCRHRRLAHRLRPAAQRRGGARALAPAAEHRPAVFHRPAALAGVSRE